MRNMNRNEQNLRIDDLQNWEARTFYSELFIRVFFYLSFLFELIFPIFKPVSYNFP